MSVTEISVWKGEKFKMIYYPTSAEPPSFSRAGGFFFDKEDKIAIAKTRGGYWTFPGGHPEEGETIEQDLKSLPRLIPWSTKPIGKALVENAKKIYQRK